MSLLLASHRLPGGEAAAQLGVVRQRLPGADRLPDQFRDLLADPVGVLDLIGQGQ